MMGTITVNVDDEVEAEFRKMAKEKFGEGKGKLGMAFGDAMKEWSRKMEQKKEREKIMRMFETGIEGFSTKGMKMRRVDMYEERGRRVFHD